MARTIAVTPDQFTNFGELLKFLRRRAGLTQRELSIGVGYSESQISRLEKNERAPDIAALRARFVPALDIGGDPEWAARLIELGGAAPGETGHVEPERASAAAPNNLPVQLTSFIGREKELGEIEQLLTRDRLITLTGPGGCGKTRLAVRAASKVLGSFPDGVWLIELAPLGDPALVPQTIAGVLGLKERAGDPILTMLTEELRGKKMLIVLDNCEHIIQAAATLADDVLRACPGVCILATSREILGTAGERAISVPSLSIPEPGSRLDPELLIPYEAVQLFVERASRVRSEFSLTATNAKAIVQVCRRLDGIPLAIELAAARVRLFSVEQIAARLEDAFRLLTGGQRTALPRHQTLQALIDWSYDLLSEEERILFRRLAVFAGGWTVQAVESVGSGDGIGENGVQEPLAHLVDKSLVEVEARGEAVRYNILETIRQYAQVKLQVSGEADAVRRKHADFYLGLAESNANWSPETLGTQSEWFDEAELEFENLTSVLTFALSLPDGAELSLRMASALGWFWFARSHWSEARALLRKALAQPGASNYPRAQMHALRYHGEMLVPEGNLPEAAENFSQALKLSEKLGDTAFTAWMLHRLGWVAREHNDPVTARARLEESIQIYKELGAKLPVGWAQVTLGEVAVLEEDIRGALALLNEGLNVMQEFGDRFGLGWAHNHLGHVRQLQGKYERARELHQASLPYFRGLGAEYGIGWAEQSLGETALAQNDAELAKTHLTSALGLFRGLGDQIGISWCLAGLAGAAALDEEPELAAFLWGAAEALRQSIGTRLAPASRATRERLVAQAQAQLGDEKYNVAWAKGNAATLADAVEAVREFFG